MSAWVSFVITAAALRSAFGVVRYLLGFSESPSPLPAPLWVYAGLLGAFTVVGLMLVTGNRRDDRAVWLGGALALVGTTFATPLLSEQWIVIRPDAFIGLFLWRFLEEFPTRIQPSARPFVRIATSVCGLVGALFAVVNLLALSPVLKNAPTVVVSMLVSTRSGLYWPVVTGLALLALPPLLWRVRTGDDEARRRGTLFLQGLLIGLMPFALEVFVEELWPAYKSVAHSPSVEPVVGAVMFGAVATVPFTTAYSVLFDRVVEVRLVLRAALQYALARYTIVTATALPFVGLSVFLYQRRQDSLASLFMSGPRPLVLLGFTALGLVTLRLRASWIEALDRRYFREPYDSQRVLTRLVGELPASDVSSLGGSIRAEVERALHADVELFVADESGKTLRHVDDRLEAISAASTVVELALADTRPMEVESGDPLSPWRRLPTGELRWLEDGQFNLLVAVRRAAGGVSGLLALRSKRSGLRYSTADRQLLSGIASAAGLALDSLRLRDMPETASDAPARECLDCSRLRPFDATRCPCGGELVEASVPHTLRGVFRFDQRIGAGGMGVVYRAVDLNLGRNVAVKALPKVNPSYVARLRREARAMASVTHPNLAVIHGVETWKGTPFLVQEFVAGGTLAQRLRVSRLPISEVLKLGITLADLLAYLHGSGVLHCDIKPGNIAYTSEGVVKLLDFGLARLLRSTPIATDADTTVARHRSFSASSGDMSSVGVFGTPPYMSPEAARGDKPNPSFDLWSLAVVLYEATTSRWPYEGANGAAIQERIAHGPAADIRTLCPDAPGELADFLTLGLAKEPARRPIDAEAVSAALRTLQAAN